MAFKVTTDQMNATAANPVQACPVNWVDLQYLYSDATPVAGARYTVASLGGSFQISGLLDSSGAAHVDLPFGVNQVKYSFHDDPDTLQIKVKPVAHHLVAPPGWLERIGDGLKSATAWVWGVLQGDFNEDASLSQIITGTVISLIPVVDQVADVRDLVANLKALIWDERYDDHGVWLAIVLTLIGAIPELGSLIKGVLKSVIKKGASLAETLKIFNYFAKGNGVKWLKKLRDVDLAKYGKEITLRLKGLLDAIATKLEKLKSYAPEVLHSVRAGIDRSLRALHQVKARVDATIGNVIDTLKKRLDEVLGRRANPDHVGPARKKNVHEQEVTVPRSREERLEELAKDPAHKGIVDAKGRHEAEVGLTLEEKGQLKGPITRDPRPDGGEFIDASGKVWDVKGFDSRWPPKKGGFKLDRDIKKVEDELGKGENVILDKTHLSQEHYEQLRKAVEERGISDRIRWYPPD